MKDKLIILEQKIKDRMEWYKEQDGFDSRCFGKYEICYAELDEVLEMIEEVRKG